MGKKDRNNKGGNKNQRPEDRLHSIFGGLSPAEIKKAMEAANGGKKLEPLMPAGKPAGEKPATGAEPLVIMEIDKLVRAIAPRAAAVYEMHYGKVKDAATANAFLTDMALAIVRTPGISEPTINCINAMYKFKGAVTFVPKLSEMGAVIPNVITIPPGSFGNFLAVAQAQPEPGEPNKKRMFFAAYFDQGFNVKTLPDNKVLTPLHLEKLVLHEIIVHGTLHHAACHAVGEQRYADDLLTHKVKRNMRHELLAAMVDFMVVRTIPKELMEAEINALRPFENSGLLSRGHIDALAQTDEGYHRLSIEEIAGFAHKTYHRNEFREPNAVYFDAVSKQLLKPIIDMHNRLAGPSVV